MGWRGSVRVFGTLTSCFLGMFGEDGVLLGESVVAKQSLAEIQHPFRDLVAEVLFKAVVVKNFCFPSLSGPNLKQKITQCSDNDAGAKPFGLFQLGR